MKKNIIGLSSTILLIVLLPVLPTVHAQQQQNQFYGGTIVMSQSSDPQTLLMGYHTFSFASYPATNMFVGLLGYDFDMTPKPNIAQSWKISPDGTTYTFNLVHNATWHDGYPLTCEDYRWSLENMVLKEGVHVAATFYKSLVNSYTCSDPYTLVVTLNFPFAPFITLWHPWYMGGALPKHLYNGTDILKNPLNFKPVGNGPFMFAEYVKGDHVRMVRNPHYFKSGQPYADEVIVKIIPQMSTQVVGLEKGEINWIPIYFPFSEYSRVSKNPDIQITTEGSAAYSSQTTLFFNLWDPNRPYVSDVRVRRAIATAINKTLLNERAMAGLSKPGVGPIPSAYSWAYDPTDPYPFNVTKANQLLDDAGYKKGSDGVRFSLKLVYAPYNPIATITTDILKPELQGIGIDLNIVSVEYQTMLDQVYVKKDFDMNVHGIGNQFPDPAGYQPLYLCSYRRQAPILGSNPASYCNPAADKLWLNASREQDQTKRGALYKQIGGMLLTDLPAVWLFENAILSAWRKEWNGFPVCPQQNACDLGAVWWSKGSPISPASATQAISNAEQQLKQLQGQFYDVGAAMAKLQQAKQALDAKDYMSATQLANQALNLAQPPYWLYGIVAVSIVVIAVAILYFRRKRRIEK